MTPGGSGRRMKVLAINRLACLDVEGLADALIDNELSVETNLLVLPHLSRCHHCKATIEEKIRIKRCGVLTVVELYS